LGPVLGTLAVATSTQILFGLVGLVSVLLMLWVRIYPEPPSGDEEPPQRLPSRTVLARAGSGLVLGTWLIALEAMTIGAVNALLPLRLSRYGASALVIGATFLGASALGSVLSPLAGRLTDRRGPRLPLCLGLVGSSVLLPLLGFPHSVLVLAGLVVLGLGGPLAGYMVPAVSVMTESAERAGVTLVLVTTLFNFFFAAGETFGAPVAAVLSQATSDAIPLIGLGGLMLFTLIPARRVRTGRALTPDPEPPPREVADFTPPAPLVGSRRG
ncbi:MAG: MFS transporter, partial [Actinomycetota bacterium]|nr:MFS transporter [Actinomycetota bacterium]